MTKMEFKVPKHLLPENKWVEVKIDCNPETMSFYIDDKLVFKKIRDYEDGDLDISRTR